jgi:fatty acid synthase
MYFSGLGYKEVKDVLPPEIDEACHNSEHNCTISGPVEPVKKFVAQLKEQGVFARVVNVANIAYHSRYIQPAAPTLFKYLHKVRIHFIWHKGFAGNISYCCKYC